MVQDSCISLLLHFPVFLQRKVAQGQDGLSSCVVHWPSCPEGARGIKVPTRLSSTGGWLFLSGILQLFSQMDLSVSMVCLVASDKDQILKLDSKAEFFISVFFSLQVKKCRSVGIGRRNKLYECIKFTFFII